MRERILETAAKLDAKLEARWIQRLFDIVGSRKFLYFGLVLWVFGASAPAIIDWLQR